MPWWVRAAGIAANAGAWLAGLFVTRWLFRLGNPRDDLRPLRAFPVVLRSWYGAFAAYAVGVDSTMGVLYDELSGLQGARLRALRERIQRGDYADDIAA